MTITILHELAQLLRVIFPGPGQIRNRVMRGIHEYFQYNSCKASNMHSSEFSPLVYAPVRCTFVIQVRFSSCPQRAQGLVGEEDSLINITGSGK